MYDVQRHQRMAYKLEHSTGSISRARIRPEFSLTWMIQFQTQYSEWCLIRARPDARRVRNETAGTGSRKCLFYWVTHGMLSCITHQQQPTTFSVLPSSDAHVLCTIMINTQPTLPASGWMKCAFYAARQLATYIYRYPILCERVHNPAWLIVTLVMSSPIECDHCSLRSDAARLLHTHISMNVESSWVCNLYKDHASAK